jgi:probable HAF family extracellular repeat protein
MQKRIQTALFAVLIIASLFMVPLAVANAAKLVTYTALDLTTFGEYASEVGDINDQGKVVGVWRASQYDASAFVWTPEEGKTDLAQLDPTQTLSFAFAINNIGQVAGYCAVPPHNHIVLWSPENTVTELNPNVAGQPRDINDAGQVVGLTEIAEYLGLQLYQLPDHAFLWSTENGMTYIPMPLGVHASLASGINNKGEIVGYTLKDNPTGVHITDRAFSYTANKGIKFLAAPAGATVSAAIDINDKGEIVGYYVKDNLQHAVLWAKNGKMVELGTLPGNSMSVAVEINDKGQVVGSSFNSQTDSHAFLWTAKAGMIDIGGPAGATQSKALAINADGQIAGISTIGGTWHGVVWYPT